MRGNIGPVTDLAQFAKGVKEEAVKRIIATCGCGSKDGCEKTAVMPYEEGWIGMPADTSLLIGCARFVKAVRGE